LFARPCVGVALDKLEDSPRIPLQHCFHTHFLAWSWVQALYPL
jgi:hypothetical protein